jgi:type II secretory pathway component PulC
MRRALQFAIAALFVLLGAAFLLLRARKPEVVETPLPRVSRLSENSWVVPQAFRKEYFADPQRVNREIRLKPEIGTGPDELRSLTIESIDQGGPIYAAGFRKGDRILEVNGTPVKTLSRALNLVQEVQKSDVLTIKIERTGTVLDFCCRFP